MTKPTGRPRGRPKTSKGWKTISVTVPVPVWTAYRKLTAAELSAVQARLREVIEAAIKTR